MTQEVLTMIHNMDTMYPSELAELFKSLSDEDKKELYLHISAEQLSKILAYLDSEEAADILSQFDLLHQQKLLDQMEPDDAADIISEFAEEDQKHVLDGLDDEHQISKLLTYDENQAGAHMTSYYLVAHPKDEIKQVTKYVIKEAPNVESMHHIFVVDENNYYLGAISLKALIKARSPLTIEAIMETYPTVFDDDDIYHVVHSMRNYATYEMPVCDHEGKLIGMITLDDAMQVYHEESKEDFEKLAALPHIEEEHFTKSAFKRVPWLALLLVLSIPIALITSQFESVITTFVILAFFQPLILDASGDVATQTLAVTLRILTKNKKEALKNGKKEMITGVITGVLLSIVAGIIAYFLALHMKSPEAFDVALVVSISLLVSVILGHAFGFLVPVFLSKLKADPAVASGPFITTLVDILSLLIYFGLASLLLGGF